MKPNSTVLTVIVARCKQRTRQYWIGTESPVCL